MKDKLAPRERLLCAFRLEKPDRVPVCPGMSHLIPARLTGKPFWDVFLNNNPPRWQAVMDCARYFNIDGIFLEAEIPVSMSMEVSVKQLTTFKDRERWVIRTVYETPKGSLDTEIIYFDREAETITKRLIKSLKDDFPKWKYLNLPPQKPISKMIEQLNYQKEKCQESGIFGFTVGYPGIHDWALLFEGGLEQATYALYDYPDTMEEMASIQHSNVLRQVEFALEFKPDVIQLCGSGTLTLGSPELFRKYGLKTVREVTKMCKQAGCFSMLHSCGKEKELVKICSEETDLSSINPLEIPPMGDCNLAELKREYGPRICLMGNLHTTDIMLLGAPLDVEKAAKQAIDDAAGGGGFILSTGDQCGTDTPEENIRKMVEVAKTYGSYN